MLWIVLDDPGSLNLPGFILSCMSTLSGVVHFYARLKIGGHIDIISTIVCNTMEYINIIEFQNYGLPRHSSPQSYYLPEMTSRKSMSGAGFKISFERIGFFVIRKFYCNNKFQRLECFCIGWLTGIVLLNAFCKITGESKISLFGQANAFKKIYLFHDCSPAVVTIEEYRL